MVDARFVALLYSRRSSSPSSGRGCAAAWASSASLACCWAASITTSGGAKAVSPTNLEERRKKRETKCKNEKCLVVCVCVGGGKGVSPRGGRWNRKKRSPTRSDVLVVVSSHDADMGMISDKKVVRHGRAKLKPKSDICLSNISHHRPPHAPYTRVHHLSTRDLL